MSLIRKQLERFQPSLGQGSSLKYSSTARMRWQGILFSFGSVAISTPLMVALKLEPYNVNMVFMLLTLVGTVWYGLVAGSLTAVLAFFCFNFFFIPPLFTFNIDAEQGWTAVFLFIGTALFANQVAGRARLSSQQAQQRAQEATTLYELATAVITKIDQREMLLIVLQKTSEVLETVNCALFLRDEADENKLVESARIEKLEYQRSKARHPDPAIAQTVFNQNRAAFFSTVAASKEAYPFAVAYLPLASGSQVLGVIVLVRYSRLSPPDFSEEEKRVIQVFANHIALAVEHASLIRENAQVATLRDSDTLKSALLASVSHELRTPLTSIKTATDNLQAKDLVWTADEREEFLGTIEQETNRLTRLVSNLLDLSRIEAKALKPDFGWYFLPEIVEEVVARLRNSLFIQSHPITTAFAANIPLTRMDYLEIDQVLTNLLENAAKYSAPESPVMVQVEVQKMADIQMANGQPFSDTAGQVILVKVLDEGRGIPQGELERIFDKFYRVRTSLDGMLMDAPGTGIGLAISKGIIETHGGQIWAQNRLYGGSVFSFTLPIVPLPADLQEE